MLNFEVPIGALNWLQRLRLDWGLSRSALILVGVSGLIILLIFWSWLNGYCKTHYVDVKTSSGIQIASTGRSLPEWTSVLTMVLGLFWLLVWVCGMSIHVDQVYKVGPKQTVVKVQRLRGADNVLVVLKSGKTISLPNNDQHVHIKLVKSKSEATYQRLVPQNGVTKRQADKCRQLAGDLQKDEINSRDQQLNVEVSPRQAHATTWHFDK